MCGLQGGQMQGQVGEGQPQMSASNPQDSGSPEWEEASREEVSLFFTLQPAS